MIYNFFLPPPLIITRIASNSSRRDSRNSVKKLLRPTPPPRRLEARDRTFKLHQTQRFHWTLSRPTIAAARRKTTRREPPFLRNSHGNPLIEPVSLQVSHKTIPANHDDIFAGGREPAA